MRTLLLFLSLFILTGCKESTQPQNTPQKPSKAPTEAPVAQLKEEHVAADFANILAPLIDPAKLDTLKQAHTSLREPRHSVGPLSVTE